MHQRIRRLAALEALYRTREEGVLHLWRVPTDSVEEACPRHDVDPEDFPAVRIHVWPGPQVSARLATPPAPGWMAQAPPGMADLEHRLREGMHHGVLPVSKRS